MASYHSHTMFNSGLSENREMISAWISSAQKPETFPKEAKVVPYKSSQLLQPDIVTDYSTEKVSWAGNCKIIIINFIINKNYRCIFVY